MNQQGFTNKNNFIGDVQVSQDLTVGDDLIIEGDIDVNDVVTNSIETNELNPKPPATKVNMGGDLDMVNQDILNCNNIALLSINGTAETDYFLKDGSRLMTGNLNMNGNDIRFVTQIFGAAFNYIGLENSSGTNTIESNAPLLIRRAGTNITVNPTDTTFSKDINMSSNDILNCDNINATTVNGSAPLTFTGTPPTVVDNLVLYNSTDGTQIKESGRAEADLFLIDGSRLMTGNLNMNGNDIRFVTQIFGAAFNYIGLENSSGTNTIESNAPLLIRRAGTNITVNPTETTFSKDINMETNDIIMDGGIIDDPSQILFKNTGANLMHFQNSVGANFLDTSTSLQVRNSGQNFTVEAANTVFQKPINMNKGQIENCGSIRLAGSTSGSMLIDNPAVISNYSILFPSSQGSPDSVLLNDGSGNLSWSDPFNRGSVDIDLTTTFFTDGDIEFRWDATFGQPQWRRISTVPVPVSDWIDISAQYYASDGPATQTYDGGDVLTTINVWYFFSDSGTVRNIGMDANKFGGDYRLALTTEDSTSTTSSYFVDMVHGNSTGSFIAYDVRKIL